MRERTRPPVHPGGILKRQYLEPLGLGISQAALALGVSRKTLSKLINERGAVTPEMALGYAFTQRGLRRTFNDLARHARIESIVTRSISGHLTERMQHHYSTVASEEQRENITKVIDLFAPKSDTTAVS